VSGQPTFDGMALAERFLIRQEYAAAWIAANLLIKMPTPESHPSFPLWQVDYTPEELWDLFWPRGFQYVDRLQNTPSCPEYKEHEKLIG
jgi:hypothetical protein